MDSVFEKITLYDLFAYFVPGFAFMCLVSAGFLPGILAHYNSVVWDGMAGYVSFVFLMFSYVVGIAISSVTECLVHNKNTQNCRGASSKLQREFPQ